MRLVKLTLLDSGLPGLDKSVFVAPGAVSVVTSDYSVHYDENDLDKPPTIKDNGTRIWAAGYADGWSLHVKEDIKFVMNALYYSNDGGHIFGSTNEGKNS